MFEKSKEAFSYGEKLVKAEKHAVDGLIKEKIPKNFGVYLWRSKKDDSIVYIGQAMSEKGLYQRIIQQHLNKNYYNKRKGEEKSSFRKAVAKEEKIERNKVVKFIEENYTISFIEFPKYDKRLADFVEKSLQFEYEPKYPKQKMIR
jgi:hypothetical protein